MDAKTMKMVVIVMMALAGVHASGVTVDGDFVVHSTLGVSPDTADEVVNTTTSDDKLPVSTTEKEGFDVKVSIHQGPHSDTTHAVCNDLHRVRMNSSQRRRNRLAGVSWRRRLGQWVEINASRPIRKIGLRAYIRHWHTMSKWQQTFMLSNNSRSRGRLLVAAVYIGLLSNVIGTTGLSILSAVLIAGSVERVSEFRIIGVGRHIKKQNLTHLLTKMLKPISSKVAGASHRKMIREWRTIHTNEVKAYGLMNNAIVQRKLYEQAVALGLQIIKLGGDVDVVDHLSEIRDVQTYGAATALGNEEADKSYRVPTEAEVKERIVIEREETELWQLAYKTSDDFAETISDNYSMGLVRSQGDNGGSDTNRDGWAVLTNPSQWTMTFEHECLYVDKNGAIGQQAVRNYMENMLTERFMEFKGVTISLGGSTPTSYTFGGDCSLNEEVGGENTAPDYQGYCVIPFEINLAASTISEQVSALKTYFDCLRDARYPMATPKGCPPIVIDASCGGHVHISPFGMTSSGRTLVKDMERRGHTDEEGQWFMRTVSTMLETWVNNVELFEGQMNKSRRGGPHFASHMTTMNKYLVAARAVTAYAGIIGESEDPEECKAEYQALFTLWENLQTATPECFRRGTTGVKEETRNALYEWDGVSKTPDRLVKLLLNSEKKWFNAFWKIIHKDRESAGDGNHYASVNLHSLLAHGTIEFRQQGGSNNWHSVMLWFATIHALVASSMEGIPFHLNAKNPEKTPLVDAEGDLTGVGALTLAQFLMSTIEHHREVEKFMEDRGVAHLAQIDLGAVVSGDYLLNTDGYRSLAWTNATKDSGFVPDEDASFTLLGGLGLSILACVATVSPAIAAVTLMVGCGIHIYVNRNLDDYPGVIEGSSDIVPKHSTGGEVKGLLKMLANLEGRGDQACGLFVMDQGGHVDIACEARLPPIKVTNHYTVHYGADKGKTRTTTTTKADNTNVPLVKGSLMMKAIHGGYHLSPEDYSNRIVAAHTRWATTGENNAKNAHPHHVGNFKLNIGIVGIHNGMIDNHREALAALPKAFLENIKDSMKGLTVDSAAIWAWLAYAGSDNDGIDLMAQHVDGSMRIIWVDKSEARDGFPPRAHIWSNCDDLWIGWLRGPEGGIPNIVFASTKRILEETWGDCLINIREADMYHHYVVDWQLGLVDLGACGYNTAFDDYDADAWMNGMVGTTVETSGGSNASRPPATNTTPTSVVKQLGLGHRAYITDPIDPNYVGECATCEDGDLLYGSLEKCDKCGMTLDDVIKGNAASCSSPTVSRCDNDVVEFVKVDDNAKDGEEAQADLGLTTLFDSMDKDGGASAPSSPCDCDEKTETGNCPHESKPPVKVETVPPVGDEALKSYIAEVNEEAAKKLPTLRPRLKARVKSQNGRPIGTTVENGASPRHCSACGQTGHDKNHCGHDKHNGVIICAACNRPAEVCDADLCEVGEMRDKAHQAHLNGVQTVKDQKAKKVNPAHMDFVVMKKCSEPECWGLLQPHLRDVSYGPVVTWDCEGPCSPRRIAIATNRDAKGKTDWQKEFDDCPCPTADDHDFGPVSPCEGSASYKEDKVKPRSYDSMRDKVEAAKNSDRPPIPPKPVRNPMPHDVKPAQHICDWIDNSLVGGDPIDPATLSEQALAYLESREAYLA